MASATATSPAPGTLTATSPAVRGYHQVLNCTRRSTMRRSTFLTALLGMSLSLAGCAGRQNASTTPGEEQTVLIVRNDNYLDHNVYLLQGLQRIRMGTARGLATSRFTIPR